MKRLAMLCCTLLTAGCVATPSGVSVIEGFDLNRYLGTWYEIARLDHRFERGLSRVTATYTPRDDGGVEVVNRGYHAESDSWKEAVGRAYLLGEPERGALKVSFFGPFYGGYNIIDLDREAYRYALVCGPTRDYLWILARQRSLDGATLETLLSRAKGFGFDTDALIFVEQPEE